MLTTRAHKAQVAQLVEQRTENPFHQRATRTEKKNESSRVAQFTALGMPRHKAESIVRKAADIGRELARFGLKLKPAQVERARAEVRTEFADSWPEEETAADPDARVSMASLVGGKR